MPNPTPPYKNKGLKGTSSESATLLHAEKASSLGFPTIKSLNVNLGSKLFNNSVFVFFFIFSLSSIGLFCSELLACSLTIIEISFADLSNSLQIFNISICVRVICFCVKIQKNPFKILKIIFYLKP